MFKRIVHMAAIFVVALTFVLTSEQASAVVPQSVRCNTGTILNTTGCHGYGFNDTMFWSSTYGINGGPIIYSSSQYAIPFTVNSAATFESFMYNLLGMSSPTDYSYNYNKDGAAFIIDTMLGHVGGGVGDFGNVTNMIAYAKENFYPTAANGYNGWTTLVDYYGSGLNSGYSISWGSSGSSVTIGAGTVNTLHACPASVAPDVCQPTSGAAPSGSADSQDFAWYALASGETEVTHPITFTGPSGVTYLIRRECGNPLGGPAWPSTKPTNGVPSGNYGLAPNIQPTINGSTASAGSVAQAGDTIIFNYYIDVTTGDDQTSAACTAASQTFTGYHQQPGTPETLTGSGTPATTCPKVFGSSTTPQIVVTKDTDKFTAADGKTYCRTLTVSPSSPSGGSQTVESCIYVASKPYVKVFGGDVAAGAAFSSSTGACTDDTNAQILSWNNDSAGYPGSGAQYAAYALNSITNFATNQNGAGSGAPSGLAFANATASGSTLFGGLLGSWPCMPDYYDNQPSSGTTTLSTSSSVNVSSLTTNVYTATGTLQLIAGNVNPNQRTQIYVDGNVYIGGNITYAGTWSVKTMPLLEIIAKGNIYIDSSVTQMDGIYVAQPNGSSGGTIYTCATGPTTPADTSTSTYYATCNNKLTVNGSLVANAVQLLRTAGSVNGASTGDTATSNDASESINGSPAFWIPSTATTSTTSDTLTPGSYDDIKSLPPIL